MYSEFYWQQKLITDICSQSFRKNVINPKLNYYRKKLYKKKKILLFGQKNLKQNYNYNVHYFWRVHRRNVATNSSLYFIRCDSLVSRYRLSKKGRFLTKF